MSIDTAAHDRLDASQVLTRARLLATGPERERLDRLAGRLADQRLRVLVAGEAKRGKSTLVNALLQRQLLPTGVTPLTSVATTVTAAGPRENEHATVVFHDGHRQDIALGDLPRFVTEAGNPGNVAEVADVVVRIHEVLLTEYAVDLVDTPGTGSVYTHNTTDADAALATLDAAILVLTADPPISAAERQLLQRISTTSVHTFVLLNKSDRLDGDELTEAVAFTEQVCSQTVGAPMDVLACSARAGRADPGFARFHESLQGYLVTHGVTDLRRALAGHLRRTLVAMLDDARIRQRSFQLARTGSRDRARQLRARLAGIASHREVIRDGCSGSILRLRRELDTAAQEVGPALASSCRQQLAAGWARLDTVPVDQLEAAARWVMASIITTAVEDWRARATQRLEEGLQDLIEQTRQAVSAQLELARAAVRQTLDLNLTLESASSTLAVDPGFRYDYTRPVGWQAPLHSSWSHLRSAAYRRQKIRADLLAEVPAMADRQLGRARSDLQRRLVEAGQELGIALDAELHDTIDRLLAVMDEVLQDSPSSTETDDLAAELATRVRGIEQLLDQAT